MYHKLSDGPDFLFAFLCQLGPLLDKWVATGKLVGVRQILDLEDPDWLTRDDVIAGLKTLQEKNVPFDLLLR